MSDAAATAAASYGLAEGLEAAGRTRADDDLAGALAIFSALRRRFRSEPAPFLKAASMLIEAGRDEEAEILLDAASLRFPDNAAVAAARATIQGPPVAAPAGPVPEAGQLIGPAWDAHHRRDWTTALEAWRLLRTHHPSHVAGFTGAVTTLRAAERLDAAEEMGLDALRRFPNEPAASIEHAWNADARRDRAEAALRWQAVRERFPDQTIGYTAGATALRELRRIPEAEALLRDAIGRFPSAPGPLEEFGWLAQVSRDWPEAARRWAAVRERFPDRITGYTAGAIALRENRQHAEAEAVLKAAAARFPDDPGVAIERAWLASHRRDWGAAGALWQEVRTRFPDHPAAYTGGATALRELRRFDEAEALLLLGLQRRPEEPSFATELAWLAQIKRDWPTAVARWAGIRERFPKDVDAYVQAARALAELWRHEEAEQLLIEAMERFPKAEAPPTQFAWIASQQNRWDAAEARFAAVRERFPLTPDGWQGGALVLRNQYRLDEAQRLLEDGMARFPNHPQFVLDHAQLPTFPVFAHQKDWPESLRRLALLRERFPRFEAGYLASVRAMRETDDAAGAEAVALEGCTRLPNSVGLALKYAKAAEDRRDWAEAVARYTGVKAGFPSEPGGDLGLARALAASGRVQEAEALLHQTMQRFETFAAPFADYAQLAAVRQDWAEAQRRWNEAQRRFPEEKQFAHRAFDAAMRLSEAAPAAQQASFAMLAPAPKPSAEAADPTVRDLVMHFESLGGRGLGCEFGIFQRDCGAEPLGLLRWADMPYEGLARTLENRFAGVGAQEHTELFLTAVGGGRAEWCTRDRRDMMFMRAFMHEDEIGFDKMYVASCRRLQFLTRKLIDDLTTGAKIFVFRLTDRNLSDEELDRLHAAIRSYGDNMLLYVRYEDAAHANGTVELIRPGLMIGYMDRFKLSPSNELSAAPPTASWLAVCKAAYALWIAG